MLTDVADFGLGTTWAGTNDDGQEINISLDGREYTFPVNEDVVTALNFSRRVVGKQIHAIILRNKTGAAVLPGEVVRVDVDGGFKGLGEADKLAAAGEDLVYVVDPQIVAEGCPDGDLFLAIQGGPTRVKQPASPVTLVADDKIKAGANGRLAKSATPSGEVDVLLGTVVEDNAVANDLVAVLLHPIWKS